MNHDLDGNKTFNPASSGSSFETKFFRSPIKITIFKLSIQLVLEALLKHLLSILLPSLLQSMLSIQLVLEALLKLVDYIYLLAVSYITFNPASSGSSFETFLLFFKIFFLLVFLSIQLVLEALLKL